MPSDAGCTDFAALATADRVARAAQLWVRHGVTAGWATSEAARRGLAAGVIKGLCEALDLTDATLPLAVYVYVLLEGSTQHPLEEVRRLLDIDPDKSTLAAFHQGQCDAAGLIALLGEHGLTQPQ